MGAYVGIKEGRLGKMFLVVLIAFLVALSTTAVLSSQTAEQTEIIRIGIVDHKQLDTIKARGGEIIADYENGYVLVKVKAGEGAYIDRYFDVEKSDNWNMIYLTPSGISFNIRSELPVIPKDLMNEQTTDEYIIHFAGPIKKDWIETIENMGGEFYSYFKYYSFLVKISPSKIFKVKNLPYVNWVGSYQPAYKIAAGLMDGIGTRFVAILGYDGINVFKLANEIDALGATVYIVDKAGLVLANADISILPEIATLSEVISIYPEELVKETMDSVANEIHKYNHAWYTNWSGLPSTLTGTGEVAGILDSGFDIGNATDGHPDFFDSPNGDRIISYYAASIYSMINPLDGWGYFCTPHGTAVAGIIASDGYAWETHFGLNTTDKEWHESEAGVAPESKLTIAGAPGASGAGIEGWRGYIGTSCNGKPCWDAMYLDDGARTISNSWRGISPYNDAVDSRIDRWNDLMILFPADDRGPTSDTILEGLAMNKNGLTVGASQNYRPEWPEAFDHTVITHFSGRGGTATSAGRPGLIKPDIVAVGTGVITTMGPGGYLCNRDHPFFSQGVPQPDYIMDIDEYNYSIMGCGQDGIPDYRYFDGTSASTPMTAGGYMLIREYLREIKGIVNPTSDLAKAFLINAAVRMDDSLYDYPGWDQGWGRVNIQESLFPSPPRTNQFVEGNFTNTGSCEMGSGTCSGGGNLETATINTTVYSSEVPLKATLVWIDYPGDALVRDLNLKVVSPSGVEYRGNAYNISGKYRGWSAPNPTLSGVDNPKWSWWTSGSNDWDKINNVEQVEVEHPEPGTWIVEVVGTSIPIGSANFSVVFAADIGPQASYRVNLDSEHSPELSIAIGGTISYPFTVMNFGSSVDNINLSANSGLFNVDFLPATLPYSLESFESQDSLALIEADEPSVTAGVYQVIITGISESDPNARDSLKIRIQVLDTPVPKSIQLTTNAANEFDPSILVLDNGTTKYIFIAYIKTVPMDLTALPRLGGDNVWLAHTTLDNEGDPVEPWNFMEISNLNEFPTDLRFNYFKSGDLKDRVLLTWTGKDSNWPTAKDQFDFGSWGRLAYSDPPYDIWKFPTNPSGYVDENSGTQGTNSKMVSFTLIRETASPQEILYVWETLGSTDSSSPISSVETWYRRSIDGGDTWSSATQLFPDPGDFNYYFFPTGCVDQNDVAWLFVYYRTPTGDDRDLTLKLYDGTWSNNILIWDTGDNVQFPSCMSSAAGPFGNRIYSMVTREVGTNQTIWVSWTDGDYNSSNPPIVAPTGGFSSSFKTDPLTGIPYGPYSVSVSGAEYSDLDYNRGPILVVLNTTDPMGEKVWITYMENSHLEDPPYPANPYGVPNIWTLHSADNFATQPGLIRVTANAFAKGHKMADALQIGGTGIVYEVYHANKGGLENVDYNIYLTIYSQDWDTKPDTLGPISTHVNTIPNQFDIVEDTDFFLTANINDVLTGMSGIAEAKYAETSTLILDPEDVDWGTGIPMNLTGNTPTEIASATVIPVGWNPGEVHRLWVCGKDTAGNWCDGGEDYTDISVEGPPGIPPGAPMFLGAELTGANNEDVTITWNLSSDDGAGEDDVIGYDIYYGTTYSKFGSGYVLLTSLPAGSDTYVHGGAGDGDLNDYFYIVRAIDSTGLSGWDGQGGKYVRPLDGGLKELVSIPLVQSDTYILEVLKTIEGSYDIVRYYKSSDQSDHWKSFKPNKPMVSNDLLYIDHKMGFWIKMLNDDNLIVAGLVPDSTTMILEPSWNLIGYPSFTSRSVAEALSAISYTKVEGWSETKPHHQKIMKDNDIMSDGNGYWVRVDSIQVLSILP